MSREDLTDRRNLSRILRRVSLEATGCWIWLGPKQRDGYGWFPRRRGSRLAHRVSYEYFLGPIPPGLELDHLCRNRACVNPFHLEAVTGSENSARSPDVVSTRNRAKTHCVHGHAFDAPNTMRRSDGARRCRICFNAGRRARRSRARTVPT